MVGTSEVTLEFFISSADNGKLSTLIFLASGDPSKLLTVDGEEEHSPEDFEELSLMTFFLTLMHEGGGFSRSPGEMPSNEER